VAKEVTRERAERKKQQAAEFMERLSDPDRAAEFDDMSVVRLSRYLIREGKRES
jgi:hypothetical protein